MMSWRVMLIIEVMCITSCTNNVSENPHGQLNTLVSVGYYCMQQYSQVMDRIGGSGGRTLMVGGQHHSSSSGPLCECATLVQCVTFLVYREDFYQQMFGTALAMGSPVSVTVANLVMEDLEQRALSSYPTPQRYVDDTLTALP